MYRPRRPTTPAPEPASKPRNVPLQILILGLPRTGIQSLIKALEILGFPSSQIYRTETIETLKSEPIWTIYLDSKYKGRFRGKFLGVEEWDDLMGEYSVIASSVPAMFTPELLASYPDAKVILTTRPTHSWLSSIRATFWHAYRPEPDARPTKRLIDKCLRVRFGEDFEAHGKETYEEHNELVRDIAAGRLLELEVGEGWERLCKFLGKDVPAEEFPKVDSWAEYKKRFGNSEI